LVTTFLLGGSAQPVEAHVQYYRANGMLRSKPLTVPKVTDPGEILRRAAQLYRRAYGADPKRAQLDMLAEQLQRMANS
jgi:hypothetical protein